MYAGRNYSIDELLAMCSYCGISFLYIQLIYLYRRLMVGSQLIILIPRWSKSDKEHQRNNKIIIFSAKNTGIWRSFCFKMAAIITLLVSTKQYNKTRRYHLSTFQVLCNYLVYFLRSNQLYTCITIFYLQDFNIFDGATKTTITNFQICIKLYFQEWKWL
jgi:hypothetical protein